MRFGVMAAQWWHLAGSNAAVSTMNDSMKAVRRPARAGGLGRCRRALRRPEIYAQVLFLVVLVALGVLVWHIAAGNLTRLSVRFGYEFLLEPAPFELGQTPIPYKAGDTYLRAFVVGTLNTLKVAVLGIALSTLIGLVIALGQLSPSIMLARVCRGYVEIVRSVPLLLQLIFWHTFLISTLPTVRQALSPVEGIYLTNRGLYLPAIVGDPAYRWVGLAALLGLVLAFIASRWARRRLETTGRALPAGRIALALFLGLPLIAFLAAGAPLALEMPELQGFNFRGGMTLTPEFAAMLLGLTLYVGAYNAEIIRAGIMAVSRGQVEAGLALGLSRGQVMRKIVLPQALRVMIPPMTNSYLNLTKESSLAVAIGYPEIVRVANITLAETSQAIECISIIMVIYLTLSLITAGILNWANARARLVER